MESKYNIAFIGLYNETNLGDPVIFDSTEWLYKKYFKKSIISGRLYLDYFVKVRRNDFFYKVLNRIKIVCGDSPEKLLYKETYKYFKNSIKNYDLLVVVGGGLIKYKYQHFHTLLSALLDAANEENKPVVFNSLGVEGYDENNEGCRMLKRAMHQNCLKYVSTRDDYKTLLVGYYENTPSMPVEFVCDPAVWASEVYDIKKDMTSNIIGIGIARDRLFVDNGVALNPNEILSVYVCLIESLIKKGYQVNIFTNGLSLDNEFAIKVSNVLLEKGYIVGCLIPSTPRMLVKTLSTFKAIVATRLHSCIIAYSLNIPAIGLVWNEKLSLFGTNIHCPNNYLRPEDFNSETIVSRLNNAIEKGYEEEIKKSFRKTIVDNVSNLDRYL